MVHWIWLIVEAVVILIAVTPLVFLIGKASYLEGWMMGSRETEELLAKGSSYKPDVQDAIKVMESLPRIKRRKRNEGGVSNQAGVE